jgi:hypothetical protein
MKKNQILKKKNSELKDYEDCYYRQESIQMIPITIEKHSYNLDEDCENDETIIQYEFSLIELPIFSKNKKVESGKAQMYIFSERDDSHLYIIPSADPKQRSNKILQEFDEVVFYGVMRLSKQQKNRVVVTDYYTLMDMAKIKYDGKQLERTKDSIERMKNCAIEINHAFYNAAIKKGKNSITLNLLDKVQIITFDEFQELPKESKNKYENFFRNSKIKEIIILTLNEDIYKNIENKGYLNFDTEKLALIDNAVSRKLYVLLMKWQGWEKKDKLVRSCRFLASRIPLSFDIKNVFGTIKVLEKACLDLKNLNLVKDFILLKFKPLANSKIEFDFFTTHDHDLLGDRKQKHICASNQNLAVETGHEDIMIIQDDMNSLT